MHLIENNKSCYILKLYSFDCQLFDNLKDNITTNMDDELGYYINMNGKFFLFKFNFKF